MSVTSGLDPAALLELDVDTFEAVEEAAARSWAVRYAFAASTLELLDVLRYLYVSAHSKPGQRPSPVLKVERPSDDDWLAPPARAEARQLTPAAFAAEFAPASSSSRGPRA